MKQFCLTLLALAGIIQTSTAQFSLTKGFSDLELSGSIQTFYNYRFYPASSATKKKNRFEIDYARLDFKGYVNSYWRYEVDVNMAGTMATTAIEDNGFLNEASATYRGFDQYLDITLGYVKIPFSRYSMLSKEEVPFLQRPEVARGDVFSRRDIGITLKSALWDQKIILYAGAYNGLGEQSLVSGNDDSGNLEFVGRAELSYPAPIDEATLDKEDTPVPTVSLGINGRYARKSTYSGVDYGIKTINGKKFGFGGDLSGKYKGFVASAEWLYFRMEPNDSTATILQGLPTDFVMSHAFIGEVSYFNHHLHSAVAIRYDEYDPSDLIRKNALRNLCFAYNYFFKGNSTLRIMYWDRLPLESTTEKWTDDQIRAAWLITF